MLPAVHTMAELKLSGNHLKGSRAVVSFDAGFEAQPHLQLLKEMLTQVFATPRQHQRVKPFFDHVISFHWADNRVWLRNYQVRRLSHDSGLHGVAQDQTEQMCRCCQQAPCFTLLYTGLARPSHCLQASVLNPMSITRQLIQHASPVLV